MPGARAVGPGNAVGGTPRPMIGGMLGSAGGMDPRKAAVMARGPAVPGGGGMSAGDPMPRLSSGGPPGGILGGPRTGGLYGIPSIGMGGVMGAQDMARTAMPGGGPMQPQPMPLPPPGPDPAMQQASMPGGQMSPGMQAGLRLGGGLLGAMQQQPGQKMGGLLGRAMLDPTMMQALQQMGPGGMLGGRV